MTFHWWMIPIGYVNIGLLFLAWQAWKVGKHLAKGHNGDSKSSCTDMDKDFGCRFKNRESLYSICFFLWPFVALIALFYYWCVFWTWAGRDVNLPPLNAHPGGEREKP